MVEQALREAVVASITAEVEVPTLLAWQEHQPHLVLAEQELHLQSQVLQ